MKRLKILSAATLAGMLTLAGAPVRAQVPGQEPSPSQIAAARELVTVVGAGSSIEKIIPALVDDIRRQGITRPELSKDLEDVLKSLQPEMDQQRQQAYFVAARSYAKYLSEQDIKDTVAFFKTPGGSRYVKALPDITEDLVTTMGAWSQLVAEYLQTRVRAEMVKRGHQMQ